MFQTYKGGECDYSDLSYNTQPDSPKLGDGPLIESDGAFPASHAFDKTSPSWDSVGDVPRGGSFDSPSDK
jgi:hypothetical protein